MDKEQIQREIEWVENRIQHLKQTNPYSAIRNSLRILEIRKQALLDKLTNKIDID